MSKLDPHLENNVKEVNGQLQWKKQVSSVLLILADKFERSDIEPEDPFSRALR
jgi:hypothetical protein